MNSPDGAQLRPQTLLLDLLGAYVHGRGVAVWSGGLVALLGPLGFSSVAGRAAVHRVVARGLLERLRAGRHVKLRLSERGERILAEGDARIFTFGRTPAAPMAGPWTVVWHQVPPSHRLQRQRLAARLRFWGFGQVRDGLWITPHDRAGRVGAAIHELGLLTRVSVVVGTPLDGIDPENAWDMRRLRESYRRFLMQARAADVERLTDAQAFVCRTELVHAFRSFVLLDPELGGQAGLEEERRRATALFDERYRRLAEPASRHVDRILLDPQYALARVGPGSRTKPSPRGRVGWGRSLGSGLQAERRA